MKTIKNMWSMDKGLTVGTLIMFVAMLALVVFIWWMPVSFGYPWYAVLGNLVATAAFYASVRSVVVVVNA